MTSGLRKVLAYEASAFYKGSATKPTPLSAADISSKAVAASNARIDCLNAIRTTGSGIDAGVTKLGLSDIGRHQQSVDEIRRQLPQPPPSSASSKRSTYPRAGTPSATSSDSVKANGSVKQAYDDLPLKGQLPRCCKYDDHSPFYSPSSHI
jgi:hypothetical protein